MILNVTITLPSHLHPRERSNEIMHINHLFRGSYCRPFARSIKGGNVGHYVLVHLDASLPSLTYAQYNYLQAHPHVVEFNPPRPEPTTGNLVAFRQEKEKEKNY